MTKEVNQIVSFVFDTQAAMEASVGYKADDLYKVALIKDTKIFHVLTNWQTGEWTAIGSTAGSSGTVLAYPYNSAGIQFALDAIEASGKPGTMLLAAVPYAGDATVIPKSGASWLGIQTKLTFTGEVPDVTFMPGGGTVINIAAGVEFIKYNGNDIPTQPVPLAPSGLSSFTIKNIAFVGGKGAIKMGALNNMGPLWGKFSDLFFFNQTDYHFHCENFQHCEFNNFYGKNQLDSTGGFHYYMSVRDPADPTGLLPGNSHWTGEHYSYCTGRLAKNFYFFARGSADCQMNELAINARMQANRYGAGTLTHTVTTVGGLSPNIVLQNPAEISKFPVGMPFVFSPSTPNWLAVRGVLWVNSNNGVDTITASASPEPAAGYTGLAITSAGTYTIKSSGFPAVMMHANGGSLIINSDLGKNWDVEADDNVCAISFSRVFASTFGLHEAMPSSTDTLITARSSPVEISCRTTAHITTDFDDSLNNIRTTIRNLNGGYRYFTGALTLERQHHNCDLYIESATPVNVTVPDLRLGGFKCRIFALGAGQVTVLASGSTVNGRLGLKSAGQYAVLNLDQSKRNAYIVSGDAVV